MNWDQWCGPSPARPYHKMYHYGNWRPWWDFGTGNLGDVACHALHVFHQELEMGAPDWVAADACQAFSPDGTVENSECASNRQLRAVALSGPRQTPGDDGHTSTMAGCSRRGRWPCARRRGCRAGA